MHIAHHDLKPGNILVSNQHYSTSKLTEDELSKAFGICPKSKVKDTMERQTLPKMHEKYEMLEVTEWWQILSAFNSCCVFDPKFRPSACEVLKIFQRGDTHSNAFHLFPLSISQATALEQHDLELAFALNSENLDKMTKDMEPLLNDGTTCCAFLALEMCNRFLHETECAGNAVLPCSWNRLKESAEDIIINFPEKVSAFREEDKLYDVSEANTILANSKRLSSQYELSEECITGNTVFSTGGRAELMRAITAKIPLCSHDNPIMIDVYMCSPYIFTLGIYNNALFLNTLV